MPVGRIILKSISDSKKISLLKTDGARLLFTWLILHVDVNGCFYGDPDIINGKVFTRLKKTHKEIKEYLEDLEKVGLIILYQADRDDFLYIPSFVPKQPKLMPEREGKPSIPLPTQDQLKSKSGLTHEQFTIRSTTSKVKESKVKESKVIVEQIISYFNNKTGQKRSFSCGKTNEFIRGRLSEGRTFEDFKHVIDVKTAEWQGDPKMERYLRPSTLFRPGNFEDYLNEKMPVQKTEPGQRNLEREKRNKDINEKWRNEYEKLKKKYMQEKGLKDEEEIDPFEFPTLNQFARKKEEQK